MSLSAPLGLLAFWGGMAAAAHAYPLRYDWRYEAISALLFPDYDPGGYLWACAGVAVCGVAGIAWTAQANDRLGDTPSASQIGLRILRLGFLCMCFAVLPDRLLPLPKGHELFAILAFLGIGFGVMQQMFTVPPGRESKDQQSPLAQLGGFIGAGRLLVPLALAGLTLAYVALIRRNLPWIDQAWLAGGIPAYLNVGAWEWITCALFSMCVLVLWHRRAEG